MVKLKLSFDDFIKYMAGMRGYIKAHEDDEEWSESAEYVQRTYHRVLHYAYVSHYDVEHGDFSKVHVTIAESELDDFYGCSSWSSYDDEHMDWIKFFRYKDEKYLTYKAEEHARKLEDIGREYDEYLASDKVNRFGKKTKKHFAETYGYKEGTVGAYLREYEKLKNERNVGGIDG